MKSFELKRFGMAVAEAEHADRRAVVANAMSRGRAHAATDNTVNVVQSWSSVLNKGISIDNEFVPPDSDTASQSSVVLGPDEHIQYLDEAVEASVEKVLKLPVAKVTDLRRFRAGGVQRRSLKIGGETIDLGPLDWSSVLAVVTGKLPKAVVCDGTWSFGKSNSEDIVRIRSVLRAHVTTIGEIGTKALLKLV